MRVLVIGGRGYLGSRTVQALRAVAGMEVAVGSRSPERTDEALRAVHVDLDHPPTFSEMAKYDVVVNTSDTVAASPVQAIEWALYNGVRFIEAGAHTATMEELLRRTRGPAADPEGWTGTLLLGMGLFPGLSNLLARQLVGWVGVPDELNVVVRLNPLAGGGPGLVELMVRATQEAAVYYHEGVRVEGPPIRPGVRLFTGQKNVPTIGSGLPDAIMIHETLGIPSVATYLSTIPTLPERMMGPLIRWMPKGPGAEKVFVPLFRRYLRLIRTVLFRNKAEFVEVNVVTGDGHQLALRTDDGIAATAHALAAGAVALSRPETPTGVFLPDELLTLNGVMAQMSATGGDTFRMSLHSTLVGGPGRPPQVEGP